jgi:RecA/RadA recombinase
MIFAQTSDTALARVVRKSEVIVAFFHTGTDKELDLARALGSLLAVRRGWSVHTLQDTFIKKPHKSLFAFVTFPRAIVFQNGSSTQEHIGFSDLESWLSDLLGYLSHMAKPGCSLFIANINYDATETDVAEHFKDIGVIKSVRLMTDRESGRPKGHGFVEFGTPEEANRALFLDDQDFMGRVLKVRIAEDRRPRDEKGNLIPRNGYSVNAPQREPGSMLPLPTNDAPTLQKKSLRKSNNRGSYNKNQAPMDTEELLIFESFLPTALTVKAHTSFLMLWAFYFSEYSMAKQKTAPTSIVDIIDQRVQELGSSKSLGYKEVSLDRGSYTSGSISMGSLVIDLITGGGMPPGKWASIIGQSGSGKSTLVYHTVANHLDAKVPVIFLDHEAGSDPTYMMNLGIKFKGADGKKNKYLHYYQPDSGDASYRYLNRLMDSIPDFTQADDGSRPYASLLVVIDSLDSMIAEEYLIKDEEKRLGLQAKMHSEGMRLLKSRSGKKNVSFLMTNQLRTKPGVSFGSPIYQPGGAAVVYYMDLTISINAVGKITNERGRELRPVNITTTKNKMFVPFRIVKADLGTAPKIALGRGIDRFTDVYAYLLLTNQLEEPGTRSSNTNKVQYRVQLKDLEGNPHRKYGNVDMSYDDLFTLLTRNKLSVFLRSQITNGIAFKMYFDHEHINQMPALDQELLADEAIKGNSGGEDEEAEEPPVKRTKRKITSDGEVVETMPSVKKKVAQEPEPDEEYDPDSDPAEQELPMEEWTHLSEYFLSPILVAYALRVPTFSVGVFHFLFVVIKAAILISFPSELTLLYALVHLFFWYLFQFQYESETL